MLSEFYPGTTERIKKGDRVYIDAEWTAKVLTILYAGSQDAQGYGCFETGGILLEADAYGVVLAVFGSNTVLTKSTQAEGMI